MRRMYNKEEIKKIAGGGGGSTVFIKGVSRSKVYFDDEPQTQIDDIRNQASYAAGQADSKYTKPLNGIPEGDLSPNVREKLNAGGSVQFEYLELVVPSPGTTGQLGEDQMAILAKWPHVIVKMGSSYYFPEATRINDRIFSNTETAGGDDNRFFSVFIDMNTGVYRRFISYVNGRDSGGGGGKLYIHRVQLNPTTDSHFSFVMELITKSDKKIANKVELAHIVIPMLEGNINVPFNVQGYVKVSNNMYPIQVVNIAQYGNDGLNFEFHYVSNNVWNTKKDSTNWLGQVYDHVAEIV